VHGSGIGVGGVLEMTRLSMAIVAGQSMKFRVETPFGKENVLSMRDLSFPHVRLFFLSHGQTGS
jgi:hypothetical protein